MAILIPNGPRLPEKEIIERLQNHFKAIPEGLEFIFEYVYAIQTS